MEEYYINQKEKIYKVYSDKNLIEKIKEEMLVNYGKDKDRAFGRYLERRGRGDVHFLEKQYNTVNLQYN